MRISLPNDHSFCQVDIKLTNTKSTQSQIQTLGQQIKNTNFISNGIILGGVAQGLLNILLGLGLPAQPLAVVIITAPAHGHQSHHASVGPRQKENHFPCRQLTFKERK